MKNKFFLTQKITDFINNCNNISKNNKIELINTINEKRKSRRINQIEVDNFKKILVYFDFNVLKENKENEKLSMKNSKKTILILFKFC